MKNYGTEMIKLEHFQRPKTGNSLIIENDTPVKRDRKSRTLQKPFSETIKFITGVKSKFDLPLSISSLTGPPRIQQHIPRHYAHTRKLIQNTSVEQSVISKQNLDLKVQIFGKEQRPTIQQIIIPTQRNSATQYSRVTNNNLENNQGEYTFIIDESQANLNEDLSAKKIREVGSAYIRKHTTRTLKESDMSITNPLAH